MISEQETYDYLARVCNNVTNDNHNRTLYLYIVSLHKNGLINHNQFSFANEIIVSNYTKLITMCKY